MEEEHVEDKAPQDELLAPAPQDEGVVLEEAPEVFDPPDQEKAEDWEHADEREQEELLDLEIRELISEIEEALSSSTLEVSTPDEFGLGASGCSADQSALSVTNWRSRPRIVGERPQGRGGGSDDSACSLTEAEAALVDRDRSTPPPGEPKQTQTDWQASGVEVINLPLLREMRHPEGQALRRHARERVLGTGVSAHFKGPMPTIVLPLDKFQPMESPRLTTCGRITPRGSTLEVISTYSARTAHNVVDAQVTYKEGNPGAVRVDLDGAGLQVVLDVTQKKQRPRRRRQQRRKVKREPFSLRPAKRKLDLDPSARRKLAWLEDEAELSHVRRMQSSRQARASTPSLAKITPPDFGPRWKDWASPSPPEADSPSLAVGRTLQSTGQHLQQMQLARQLGAERGAPRRLASPPRSVPPPEPLTQDKDDGAAASVYETEATRRLRLARQHYATLSADRNAPPRQSLDLTDPFSDEDTQQLLERLDAIDSHSEDDEILHLDELEADDGFDETEMETHDELEEEAEEEREAEGPEGAVTE